MNNNKQTAIDWLIVKLPSLFINAITTIVMHIVSTAIISFIFILLYVVYILLISMNII